ncbi:MAG: hypothetical protein SF052_11095 [Bacteroidia bacterium]|nr:hypothetical protein [Bacteroidia bacterium]
MKKLLRYLWFLGFVFPSLVSFGQGKDEYKAGYILTLSNDSLPGFILLQDHVFNTTQCRFKVSSDGEEQSFSPEEIRGYGSVEGEVFRSGVNSEQKAVFFQYKTRGKYNLLYYRETYFIEAAGVLEELIMSQEKVQIEDRTFAKAREEYKYLLREKMINCLEIDRYLKATEFNLRSLSRLFENYAQCSSTPFVSYEYDLDKMKIRLGLSAGVMGSVFDMIPGNSARYVFTDFGAPLLSVSFVPSFLAEFSFPSLTEKASVRTGVTLYSATNEYYRKREEAGIVDIQDVTVTSARVEIPLYLRYAFSRKGRGPYVIGGLGMNRFIKWETLRVHTVEPGIVTTFSDLEKRNFFVNYLIGAGMDFPLGKRVVLGEVVYGFAPYLLDGSGDPMPTAWFQTVSLSGGVLF